MTAEQKAWIDGSSYGDLLRKWRFAPTGDPMIQGECGNYFAEKMKEKRAECDNPAAVSKMIGWG